MYPVQNSQGDVMSYTRKHEIFRTNGLIFTQDDKESIAISKKLIKVITKAHINKT